MNTWSLSSMCECVGLSQHERIAQRFCKRVALLFRNVAAVGGDLFSIPLLCALLLSTVCVGVILLPQERPNLKVVACDVGQGDAILLLYDALVILIDVGPNSAVIQCLQEELPFGRRSIDLLILTHADKDHIGGFSDVVKTYKVNRLLYNPNAKETEAAKSVTRWVEEHPESHAPQGGEMLIAPGLRLWVLWSHAVRSTRFGPGEDFENVNSDSISILVQTKGFGFLSLGDLECREELAVSGSTLLGSVRLLKMSHHGAKTSSCLEFLQKISPEVAFYSAGKGNTYGHPHPETLKNAQKAGIITVGTPEGGRLEFLSTAQGLVLRAQRPLNAGRDRR